MRLYCDKKVVINIAYNLVQYGRTVHIDIDRHFIKEKLKSEEIYTPYVKTKDQFTDIWIIGVLSKIFYTGLGKLGLCYTFAPA